MTTDETLDMPKVFEALSLWITKSIVLLLSSAFSYGTFVLGNDRVSGPMAAVFVALLLTLSSFTAELVADRLGLKIQNKNLKIGLLFAEASLIIWTVKLLSLITGFGIANLLVVFVVAGLTVLVDEPLLKQIRKIKFEG